MVVAFIGYGFYLRSQENKKMADVEASAKVAKLDIHLRDSCVGDIIHIKEVGPKFDDITFKIDGIHTYVDEDGFEWGEAYGDGPTGKVFLEFIEDDEIELFVKIGKMDLSLSDLGISLDDLWKIDEKEDGYIEYNGERFKYEDSGDVTFYHNGEGNGEGFYSWDFISDDDMLSLSIEKYGSQVSAGLCNRVNYRQVELTRP